MRKEAPVPEVAAKRQAVDVRAEWRPTEEEEGRVGSVSAGLHQPTQTYAAGPARTGAKRRKNPAAHGRQHGSFVTRAVDPSAPHGNANGPEARPGRSVPAR